MKNLLPILKKYIKNIDLSMIFLTLMSSIYGILLIYSCTKPTGGGISRTVIIQIIALLLGIFAMVVISRFDYDILCDLWIILYILTVAVIIFTIIFGTGPTGKSNRNWIDFFGIIYIQPSEFLKLSYILIVAKLLDKCKNDINSLKSLLFLGVTVGVLLLMIALQGDLGSALVFLFITATMFFIAGLSIYYFIAVAGALVLASPLIWTYLLSGYMKNRILFGFRPELDPADVGYQAIQSKIAIGSGGMVGKGFLQGTQIDLLPAKHTDFIFATAGEEFGFIGSALIVILLSIILIKFIFYARRTDSDIGALICMGLFAMFFAQIAENIGMCLAILPIVGITLPFFSYGGSSMISAWCAIGLAMSVYSKRMGLRFGQD